ncbi:MAG: low specificity L-threonine aldolase [Vicinamibacterales bacterium]
MTTSPELRYDFASDNTAGICPEAWAAMERANQGRLPSYGDDPWTTRAADLLRDVFERDCDVYFVFNGTAANALAIAAVCQSYHSVICHDVAHLERDECGATEFFSNGTKVLLAGGAGGRLDPAGVERLVTARRDIHFPKPRVVSLTQATELGTVYTPSEVAALSDMARRHGLAVHMDGARVANAAAALGVPPRRFTWEAGVDVLCFGGTKNGMAVGDAVVFFRRELAQEFDYRCKQAGQLCSKMRFLAAPWVGLLEGGAWLRNGARANAMAARLAAGAAALPGVALAAPVQANGVFLDLSDTVASALRARGWVFYNFIGERGHRFMCAWDTSEAVVEALLEDLRAVTA